MSSGERFFSAGWYKARKNSKNYFLFIQSYRDWKFVLCLLQAFHVANDNAALDVRRAATSVGDTIDVCPSLVALNGRSYHQHVDFSEYGFTQTLCMLGAVVNNANDTFDVANYIYTTKGENIIDNDAEDDSPYVHSDESYRHKDDYWARDNDVRNLRRNFSGNITIATYK